MPANACGGPKLTMAQAAATTELSADTTGEKKKVRKATKMKKEKVEYMRSAAPPEFFTASITVPLSTTWALFPG